MSPRAATLVSLASTVGLYLVFWLAGEFGSPALSSDLNESLLKAAVWILPSLAVVALAWRLSPRGALREIGLFANPLTGVVFAFLSAIPLLVLSFHTPLNVVSPRAIAATSLVGPFAEEVLFRGLLFRQLVRRGQRRVLWAMAVSAIIFGAAHLTSLVDIVHGSLGLEWEMTPYSPRYLSEFGLTAFGGLLFAWIAYRWDSLWPASGLHACLNLSWQLTNGASDVTAFAAAMTRLASVTIACYLTWRLTRTTTTRTGLTSLSSAIGER